MNEDVRGNTTGEANLRSRLWSRLRGLGLLREPELIRVYQVAQQNRISPEQAAVALGVMTEQQARDLLCGT